MTCKSGPFVGQSCSDLTDKVLVGAGRLGRVLDLKDASLPDHMHRHTHTGLQNFSFSYKTGPPFLNVENGYRSTSTSAYMSEEHDHTLVTESFNIDFGKMTRSEAFISRIPSPKVSKSTEENELYSSHLRVIFMFKCY